jgi:hypothetical protein
MEAARRRVTHKKVGGGKQGSKKLGWNNYQREKKI